MRRKVVDEKPEKSGVYGSPEEMLDKAKTEYFVEIRREIWYTVRQERS